MPRHQLVSLPSHRTPGKPGLLAVAEVEKTTNGLFGEAKRVYWIVNDTDGPSMRGGHYHPEGGKLEFLVCLHGRAEIELHATEGCDTVVLTCPTQALVIPGGVWHGVLLSPGAILMSVASTLFRSDEARTEKSCAHA